VLRFKGLILSSAEAESFLVESFVRIFSSDGLRLNGGFLMNSVMVF